MHIKRSAATELSKTNEAAKLRRNHYPASFVCFFAITSTEYVCKIEGSFRCGVLECFLVARFLDICVLFFFRTVYFSVETRDRETRKRTDKDSLFCHTSRPGGQASRICPTYWSCCSPVLNIFFFFCVVPIFVFEDCVNGFEFFGSKLACQFLHVFFFFLSVKIDVRLRYAECLPLYTHECKK